ncbi:SAGA complex subunit spt20 [Apiospora hydei]|uniref:SAGA complex subunit spt20 n=1 Tax=Apiospora hydei TaxID=1337664 RepID=A0ABR1XDQ8_9PEZI
MAPVVAATPTPVPTHNPNKIKRPPGIQTNGAISARSSPSQSPSMSAKKPPNAAVNGKQQPITHASSASHSVAINGVNGSMANRPNVNRPRRDTNTHNQKKPSLRSASQALDSAGLQNVEPRPAVITDKYILSKFAGSPPSLIVHLHPTHFRFDQQDGIFPYKSPMRVFLEHIRTRTLPHDLLTYFIESGVPFYDGCLIVQVHDHKSAAQAKESNSQPTTTANKTAPFSVHNYNTFITPSPYVPYPKDEANGNDGAAATSGDTKGTAANTNEKENMPAPALPDGQKNGKVPQKSKIITVVLHPTPHSLQTDLMIKASTPADSKADGSMVPPPTPITAMPPTPTTAAAKPPPSKKQKREKMELDGSSIQAAEGQILLATGGPLFLEPTKNAEETISLLEHLADDKHSDPQPLPKGRKRTVAERAADEALAADHEKYMLTLDERLSFTAGGSQGGGESANGNGQSGGATFEPRFERFKVIEDIKRAHAEKKEQEKLHQAEQERKLNEQRKQQQEQQRQQEAEKTRRDQEAARVQARQQQQQQQAEARRIQQEQATARAQAQAQAQAQQAQQQAQQQAAAAAAAQQQAQAQAAAAAAQSPPAMQHQLSQASHGHPPPSPMPGGLQQHRFQNVSQPPVSSPVVRQGTPQNMSSPMVGNVPMQQTNSAMGGSPPRPSSVVQNHGPMSVPMSAGMSARGSQQSHPGGTPRMPNTPMNRPMATPRMTQASPPPGMMASNSQPGQNMMMNGQNMQHMQSSIMAAQLAAQQQRQQIAARQQMAAMQMNGQNPQQQMQQQIQQQFQAQINQQRNSFQQQLVSLQQNGMLTQQAQQQLTQNFQQRVAQLQQQQMHMQNSMNNQQQMGNMNNFASTNGMSPPQMAAMHQMQQQQQQQLMRAQQQQQQQQQNLPPQLLQKQGQIFQHSLQVLAQTYGNPQNIPQELVQKARREAAVKAREMFLQAQAQLRNQQQLHMMQQQQQQQQNMGGNMMQGM